MARFPKGFVRFFLEKKKRHLYRMEWGRDLGVIKSNFLASRQPHPVSLFVSF